MEVTVRLYGPARRCGCDEAFAMDLPDGATADEFAAVLGARSGQLDALLPSCAIAVGDDIVGREHVLSAGDNVSVLPPVNGGDR